MLGFLTSKLGLSVITLLIIAGTGYYIVHLIETRAVLEATVEAERASLAGFADEVTMEIEGYKVAMGVLMSSYQEADNEQSRLEKLLAKHDLESLAKSKPGLVSKRINSGIVRMFKSIEDASRLTEDARTTGTTEAESGPP